MFHGLVLFVRDPNSISEIQEGFSVIFVIYFCIVMGEGEIDLVIGK